MYRTLWQRIGRELVLCGTSATAARFLGGPWLVLGVASLYLVHLVLYPNVRTVRVRTSTQG
ncbi:hypothetical protein C8Q77DRAFT_1138243 [Trametes polyzona]|nr:hypothetical protein C8Q77DRAFT_1138243 [Trametes polyzona]